MGHSSHIGQNLTAGFTTAIMLVPQAMGYSMLAGLPPAHGLFASLAPLVVYALIGRSRELAVGPVAMVAIMVATSVSGIAQSPNEYIALAALLAVIVGVVQILMGALRMGQLVSLLSHPVISGFTSAAALIIASSQIKHFLGVKIERSHHVHKTVLRAADSLPEASLATFLLGVGSLAILLVLKRYAKKLPGALAAVIIATLVTWLGGLYASGVSIVGTVPSGLPIPALPTLDTTAIATLLPAALAIALVGYLESFAVAQRLAKANQYKINPDRELLAIGAANIAAGFTRAFPIAGGFSRTAVNAQAGASHRFAGIVTAAIIALSLLFFTPLFYYLPKATLAAIIMVAVIGLINVKEPIHLWKSNRGDFWILIATFVGTLLLGIEKGIAGGVVASILLLLLRTSRPRIVELGKMPGEQRYCDLAVRSDAEPKEGVVIIRMDAQLYFGNASYFAKRVREIVEARQDQVTMLIIDMTAMNQIDSTGVETLHELQRDLGQDNIELRLAGAKKQVRDTLTCVGSSADCEAFGTVHDACVAKRSDPAAA